MAEKILKSIKFPGLEDTYVVPSLPQDIVNSVNGKIGEVQLTGEDITVYIEELDSNLSTQEYSQAVFTGFVETLGRVNANEETLNEHSGEISTLKEETNTLKEDVNTLKEDVNTLEENISEATNAFVEDINSTLSSFNLSFLANSANALTWDGFLEDRENAVIQSLSSKRVCCVKISDLTQQEFIDLTTGSVSTISMIAFFEINGEFIPQMHTQQITEINNLTLNEQMEDNLFYCNSSLFSPEFYYSTVVLCTGENSFNLTPGIYFSMFQHAEGMNPDADMWNTVSYVTSISFNKMYQDYSYSDIVRTRHLNKAINALPTIHSGTEDPRLMEDFGKDGDIYIMYSEEE